MTLETVREIISAAPLGELEKNAGILEFYIDGDLSIGVSYEDDDDNDGEERYIYNIFFCGEYINIVYEQDIEAIICDLTAKWNDLEKYRIKKLLSNAA